MAPRKVIISRTWSDPAIKVSVLVDVDGQGIELAMALDDFLRELAVEVGNPTFLMTVTGLQARMVAAAEEVCRQMKLETAKVM